MLKVNNRWWKPMLGKNHSEETKLKISKKRKEKIGPKSSNWKGGKMIVDGYVYIYSPTHPNKTKLGYVCEHRLVMEKLLGRYLTKKEVIHHKDENKQNNTPENLELYSSCGEHSVIEHIKRGKDGRFK
jgi:hypothetical protein